MNTVDLKQGATQEPGISQQQNTEQRQFKQDQSAVSRPIQVDRRSNLTYEEFVSEYRNPGKPVIFTDLTKHWIALNQFTPEFFEQELGDRQFSIGDRVYTLREAVQLLKQSTREHPAPYPMKLNLRQPEFADLRASVSPRPALALPDRTRNRLIPDRLLPELDDLEVFLGGPGGEFPYVHYDYLGLYAWINQLYGEKQFTVFPPEQQPYLYPQPNNPWVSDIANIYNPDLDKYPLFAKTTPSPSSCPLENRCLFPVAGITLPDR